MRKCLLLRMEFQQGARAEMPSKRIFHMKSTVDPSRDLDALRPEPETALQRLLNRGRGTPAPIVAADGRRFGESEDARAYQPPLLRDWVKAPPNRLTTESTRKEWFRFMQCNVMCDAWTPEEPTGLTTTPVSDIDVRIPACTRAGHEAEDGAVSFDPRQDHLPPFLQWSVRQKHLLNEIRHHDPDIICVNELNRAHFVGPLWPQIRYEGYGGLFVSSRGRGVKHLKQIDDSQAPRHARKVSVHEDIGNAIFFHRSRFVPMMLPGPETPRHLHYGIFAALRDTVTNCDVFVACLQLTAGATVEAAGLRAHECASALKVMDAIVANNSSRSHGTVIICGDFNNVADDEECVTMVRDRFYSTYDIAGGPQWTAWYHQRTDKPNKYYAQNLAAKRATDGTAKAEQRTSASLMPQHMRNLALGPAKARQLAAAEAPKVDAAAEALQRPVVPLEAAADALVARTVSELQRGVVHRTQDFIFYDPGRVGLLQVLDVPSDEQVDQDTLFPSRKNPSHHVPLIVDLAFHDHSPDVGLDSLKP